MTPATVPPPCCTHMWRPGDGMLLCIGSDCHRFVPEITTIGGHNIRLREHTDRDVAPTGLGVCADNLRAVPWVDVAAGVKS